MGVAALERKRAPVETAAPRPEAAAARRFPFDLAADLARSGRFAALAAASHLDSVHAILSAASTKPQTARLMAQARFGAASVIRRFGAERQRRRAASDIRLGSIPALALAERALSGSHATEIGGLRVRAWRRPAGWTLEGEARAVSGGDAAALVLVFAKTPGRRAPAALIVDRERDPGVLLAGRRPGPGRGALTETDFLFDAARLPQDAALEDGDDVFDGAWAAALASGRLGSAALALGLAATALDEEGDAALQKRRRAARRALEQAALTADRRGAPDPVSTAAALRACDAVARLATAATAGPRAEAVILAFRPRAAL